MPTVQAPIRTHWRVRAAFERRLHDAIRDAAAETETLVEALEKENAQLKAEVLRLTTELTDARDALGSWKRIDSNQQVLISDLKKSAA